MSLFTHFQNAGLVKDNSFDEKSAYIEKGGYL